MRVPPAPLADRPVRPDRPARPARVAATVAVAVLLAAPLPAARADSPPAPSAPAPSAPVPPAASPAPAELSAPRWSDGPRGRQRRNHVIFTLGLGALYGASELLLKSSLSPEKCRWCEPPGFDADVRNALVWDDARRARTLSDLAAYGALPLFSLGLTVVPALRDGRRGAELLDVALPITESVILSQSLAQLAKFSLGRQRPFAHFDGVPGSAAHDDNLSFFSAHSSFAFSLVTSAATVAHQRGSRAEPWIWGLGVPLASATGYLRLAGDKHYHSDGVVGGLVGVATGLLVPRWYAASIAVVPTQGGAAVAGSF